ncbi:unnamed protein product, partial [Meganyctiphanes norvegica]
MMENPILNLRWRQHGLEFTTLLDDIRRKGLYSDATISCEDREYHVHSALLSISSDFFTQIFKERCCEKPFIIMNGVLPIHLEKLLIYIYTGEVSIDQDDVSNFLELGKLLKIKGATSTSRDNCAISATATNIPGECMIEHNPVVEQLETISKTSGISKLPLPDFIRKDGYNQNRCKESISKYNKNNSREINAGIQSVIRKKNVKINVSDHKPRSRNAVPLRCPATPSLPWDLTLDTTNSPASISLPPAPSSLLSSSSFASSSFTASSFSASSSSSSSSSFTSSSSSSSSSQLSPSVSSWSTSLTPKVTGDLPPSLPLINSIGGTRITAPITSIVPQTVISPFETLLKEEPIDCENVSGSENVDMNSANIYTETNSKIRNCDADISNNGTKVVRTIPPIISHDSRSEKSSHRQVECLGNRIPSNYTPDIWAFPKGIPNQAVPAIHSNYKFTSSAPSRMPSPFLQPRPPVATTSQTLRTVLSQPPGPPPFQPLGPFPPPALIPLSNTDHQNSIPYSRPSDKNYPDQEYIKGPSNKSYPYGETGKEKCSQCPYAFPHRHADGSHCDQHHKKSPTIMKDLDPTIQIKRVEKSSEENLVNDTPLSHRNPRLLVNTLPVGPSRY